MTMKDRLPIVADLLMDAAFADQRLEGEEKDAVKRLLRELLDSQALPMDVDFRIDEFDPKKFERAAAAAAFAGDPPALKRRLLELVAAVHAADGEIDFAEDEHLRALGAALGLPPESFSELVVDVVEEMDDIGQDLEQLRYGPS
jgi:tellurite resistance protein